MKHLIQEIKDLLQRPRLLIQYLILNFFLISVGVAAVVYTKKGVILEHSRVQSEQILNVSRKLDGVDLPRNVEKDINHLQQNAEQTLKQDDQSELPKTQASSAK